MQPQSLPASVTEPNRLRALAEYRILDTAPEQGFDDVAELACRLCAAPVALVSLVASDRQWFKARVNFPPCETDLDSSVCAFTLDEPDLLVIPDLTADPRTAANPLVTGEPHIRFYAGAPLRLPDGPVLGSLCVIDRVPRPAGLNGEQADSLRRLARQVVELLGLRRAVTTRDGVLARQDAELRQERRLALLAEASAVMLNASDPAGTLIPILDAEAAGLGFEQSFAYNYLADTRQLALTHAIGADEGTRTALRRISVEVPLCGLVVTSGRPLILDHLQEDSNPRYAIARDGGIQAYAGYPITCGARVCGAISFASQRVAAFEPEALAFFTTIARLLSLAHERLMGEAALRANEERLNLAFQASATVGWWDWDVPTDQLTTNAPFARLIGADPASAARGITVAEFWRAMHPDDEPAVRRLVDKVLAKPGPYLAEYRLIQRDGAVRWVLASGHCYHDADGRPSRFPGILVDTTDATLAAQRQAALTTLGDRLRDLDNVGAITAAAAEIVGTTLGLSRAGYCSVDVAKETVQVQRDWAMPGLTSIIGEHRFRDYGSYVEQLKRGETVLVRDVLTDPRTADTAAVLTALKGRALFNLPLMERGRFVGLFYALCGQPRAWSDQEVAFLRGVADRTRAAIARVEAEEQQHLLNGELSHRLKNTLSMVLSIATQTLRGVPERGPVETFEQRVHALASAHDVLLRRSRHAAPLREVVAGVLKGVGATERAEASGPPVPLGSRAALSFALVLHEMATNATKYGALSNAAGRVRLTWRIEGKGDTAELVMDWREAGGPPVAAPTRRGFGSRLIRLGLVGAGGVELRYVPEGFQAEMRAPLLQLQQS